MGRYLSSKKVQNELHHLAYSVTAPELADVLQDWVERMIDGGAYRETLYESLKILALDLRREGREDLEDEVLEVMDVISGWCAPSTRL
jgi:hypothetical protein